MIVVLIVKTLKTKYKSYSKEKNDSPFTKKSLYKNKEVRLILY